MGNERGCRIVVGEVIIYLSYSVDIILILDRGYSACSVAGVYRPTNRNVVARAVPA